jgi:hypothetical protein
MKKKIITPILLIVFSFLFLITPGQIIGATACGGSCTKTTDCWPTGTDVSKVACPHCWPPNYDTSKANSGTICAQAGANCTCVATPATPAVDNTNMCNKSCIADSECANDANGCTVCWATGIGSGFGDCTTGGCTCIKEADKLKNEAKREKEKALEEAILESDICSGNEEYSKCRGCMYNDDGTLSNNTWTDFGCLETKVPGNFVKQLLKFGTGIGGGIAFLFLIFGSIQIILSGGNPDRVKAGREMITAAIGGLLLIIFSVFILRLIGYDILKIPGFGK